jgi:hypothetical protein
LANYRLPASVPGNKSMYGGTLSNFMRSKVSPACKTFYKSTELDI